MSRKNRIPWISIAVLSSFTVLVFVIASVQAESREYAFLADIDHFDSWQYVESMPLDRSVMKAAVLNQTIYAVGGYNYQMGGCVAITEAYDPANDQWTSKANLFTARCSPGLAAAAGRLFAIGGWNTAAMTAVASVESYDPRTNTWTEAEPIPKARNSLAAVSVENKIYAMGGWDGWVMDDLTVYDPVSDTWTALSPMPTPRNSLAAAVVDGLIYAIGGWDGITATTKVEVYDPAIDQWSTAADMPTARWDLGAAAINDRIYAIGGATGTIDETWLREANEEYDPKTNTWRSVTPMQLPRWGFGAAAFDNRIYAMGGVNHGGEVATNEVYTPPAASAVHLPAILKPSECVCPGGRAAAEDR